MTPGEGPFGGEPFGGGGGAPPTPPSPSGEPTISFSGERLYQSILPVFVQDEEAEWFGRYLCEAVMEMFQDVDGIVLDWPADVYPITGAPTPGIPRHPGWSVVTSPECCPDAWVPWCARLFGVTLTSNTTPQEQRRQIQELPPQKRGGLTALERAVRNTLAPGSVARFTERPSGKAYHLVVEVSPEQTLIEEEATRSAILTQKPAGIIISYSSSAQVPWDVATKRWDEVVTSWDNIKSGDV